MSLTPASAIREDDPASASAKEVLTLETETGEHIQVVAIADESGDQAGGPTSPMHVQGAILTTISTLLTAIQTAVETLDNIVSGNRGLVTEDNSASILAALREYGTNDVAVSGDITYVGKEKLDGTWLVLKIDVSSDTEIRYASLLNNGAVADYAAAWAGRAGLSYGTYAEAF